MKKQNKTFDDNICRLVKRTQPTDTPCEKFTQNLLDEVTAELTQHRQRRLRIAKWLTAVAALIIGGVAFFMYSNPPAARIENTPIVGKTPAQMITMTALNIAYRRGGMEAVERQYQKAIQNLGPRPVELTIDDLFAELNGG